MIFTVVKYIVLPAFLDKIVIPYIIFPSLYSIYDIFVQKDVNNRITHSIQIYSQISITYVFNQTVEGVRQRCENEERPAYYEWCEEFSSISIAIQRASSFLICTSELDLNVDVDFEKDAIYSC